jgi:hypothetical protein
MRGLRVWTAAGVIAGAACMAGAANAQAGGGQAPLQLFAGPTFERFAAAADAACPRVHARDLTAGDLAGHEEAFSEALAPEDRARLRSAVRNGPGGGVKACETRNGLSCPASRTLDAIAEAGLMDRFVSFVCAQAGRGR